MESSALVSIQGVNKSFGPLHVLKDIELQIPAGEAVVLLGPSGSGKSTLLRCVNGLEQVDSGKVIFDGTDLTEKSQLLEAEAAPVLGSMTGARNLRTTTAFGKATIGTSALR